MSKLAADTLRRWREHPSQMVRELFKVTPDPWQEKILEAFLTNPRIAMVACRGPGKLQPKSLTVDTPLGRRKWGDLSKGDFVFAQDGSPTRIVNTYENGVVRQYKVTFDDGSFTFCGAEHLWKVQGRTERRKKLGWAVLTTQQIVDRGVTIPSGKWKQKQFIIPTQGAVQYSKADLPVDPYVAGIWIGDGTRKTPHYTKPYLEVEQEINRRGYTTRRYPKEPKKVALLGCMDKFKKFECFDKNSFNRFIPDNYKYSSAQQRKDLLCGLMDSDGSIDVDTHMEFSTTSKRLAEDVVWLVRSLGGIALIKEGVKKGWYKDNWGRRIDCRDCYRVTVKLPFNPFRIKHKSERWHPPQERYLTRYIASIECAHEEDSMCIEVAHPSKCYLTNDFIVTHNTCVLAWLMWNFILTRPHPKIAAVSITADALMDNLWSELAFWQNKSELLKAKFTWQKTRIFANDHPETWWMSARQWSKSASVEEQGRTLAGLHSDYILFVLDESSGMPDAILGEAEAALSSCKEGHIVQAGNPSINEGPLYRAAKTDRKKWYVTEITGDPNDPNRSPRVSIEWAKDMIEKYGIDNPWVLINVFGKFAPSSINALISDEEVKEAMARYYRPQDYSQHARILSCDVAREGSDSSVVFSRQGLQVFVPDQYRNIDGTQGANIVARKWREWDADACFIDNTGGFGSSWIDNLNRLGFAPIPVHFNAKSPNPRYYNIRTQMAFECIEWVKNGGALPDIPELLQAMTKTTYTFKGDKVIIEPKELIKVKLGYSPDHFDSLMLGWAAPVTRGDAKKNVPVYSRHTMEYNPLAIDTATQQVQSGHMIDYNPLRR